MERADVVDDPERASLGRDHQVSVMHLDVRHRHIWEVQLKRLPVAAVVKREKDTEFRSGVKQPFPIWIFADYSRRPIRRDAVLAIGQPRPRLSVIIRAIEVRLIIAE